MEQEDYKMSFRKFEIVGKSRTTREAESSGRRIYDNIIELGKGVQSYYGESGSTTEVYEVDGLSVVVNSRHDRTGKRYVQRGSVIGKHEEVERLIPLLDIEKFLVNKGTEGV